MISVLHVRIARSKQNPCCMWVAKRYPPSLACTYMYIYICICTTTHPHPQTHRTITFAHLYCCHGHEVVKTTRNQLHYLSACEQCPIRTSELVSRASRIFPRMRMRVRKWEGEGKEKYVWAQLPGFRGSNSRS